MFDYHDNEFRGYTIKSYIGVLHARIASVTRPDATLVDPHAWGFFQRDIGETHQACTDWCKPFIERELKDKK